MRFEDQPQHVRDERDALHEACGLAYEQTGTIRSAKWQKASRALRDHEMKYGIEYNPD